MNTADLSREICALQNRLGRRESTLFVHTPVNDIKGLLFKYLMYLKYVDGGKTFVFTPGNRVLYRAFRLHATEWILVHSDTAVRIDWTREHESLKYFGLCIEGDDVVGLGYE